MGHLPRGVRIETHANPVDNLPKFFPRRVFREHSLDGIVILVAQHALLREDKLEHGVVGQVLPVDKIPHDVVVRAKRQDTRDNLYGLLKPGFDRRPLGRPGHVVLGNRLVATIRGIGVDCHGLYFILLPLGLRW